jgi:ribosomal protein S18 acetylase RimI-like enzyme
MEEKPALEFRRVSSDCEAMLTDFFSVLESHKMSRYFHPHPFTPEKAKSLCLYEGKDLYYVASDGTRILGYGMLRGWDEGYDIPSLGIVLHPEMRGIGLGKLFMHFLHAAAKLKGANRIRLKVYPENEAAVNLYKNLGYRYEGKHEGQLVGYLDF